MKKFMQNSIKYILIIILVGFGLHRVLQTITPLDARAVATVYDAIATDKPLPMLIKVIHNLSDINTPDSHRLTLLHMAAKKNNRPLVEYLLNRNPPAQAYQTDFEGRTALIYAAQAGYALNDRDSLEIMKMLLDRYSEDNRGLALMVAAFGGYTQEVELLLKRISSYERPFLRNLKTRIEVVSQALIRVIDILSKVRGEPAPVFTAPVLSTSYSNGLTSGADLETIIQLYRYIVEDRRADNEVQQSIGALQDINVRDPLGMNVLSMAAKGKSIVLLELILRRNPEKELADKEGYNALYYAVDPLLDAIMAQGLPNESLYEATSLQMVRLLLPGKTAPNLDKHADALRAAAEMGWASVVDYLLKHIPYQPVQLDLLINRLKLMVAQYPAIEKLLAVY